MPVSVEVPETVEDVVGALGGDGAVVIAGGTQVMPRLNTEVTRDRHAGQPAPRGPGRDRGRAKRWRGLRPRQERRRDRRRRHDARAARRGRPPRVPAAGRRVDRLADDPQPRHRRRQPVRRASPTATSRSRCSRSTPRPTSPGPDAADAAPSRSSSTTARPRAASSPPCAFDDPADASATSRRCGGGSTPARSSPSPPRSPSRTAPSPPRGSRSAARAPRRVARPAAEAALVGGPLDAERAEAAGARRARRRRAVHRRLRERLVPRPRPARPRPPRPDRRGRMRSRVIELTVNDEPREFLAPPGTTLLSALREQLGLTAAKRGCAQGTCGTCTVLLDGEPVMSCLVPVETIDGAERRDARGRAAPRRRARRGPGGVPRGLRHPVRLLHLGHDHGRGGAAGLATPTRAATTSSGRSRATSAAARATSRSSTRSWTPRSAARRSRGRRSDHGDADRAARPDLLREGAGGRLQRHRHARSSAPTRSGT